MKRNRIWILPVLLLCLALLPGRAAAIDSVTVKDGFLMNSSGLVTGYQGGVEAMPAEVWIPEDATGIGDYAFSARPLEGAPTLRVHIPAGVASIGSGAFSGWTRLTAVDFAPGSRLERVGKEAFSYCYALGSIDLPDSVATIGESAFLSCTSLSEVHLPESLTGIPDKMLNNTAVTSVTIPAGVTSIGSKAFSTTRQLAEVTFAPGSKLRAIGSEAFWDCAMERIELPDTVRLLGTGAFAACSNLTTAKLSPNLWGDGSDGDYTTLPERLFNSCKKLRRVDLCGAAVYSIGKNAFAGCKALDTIVGLTKGAGELEIPETVNRVDDGAFYGCDALVSAVLPARLSVGYKAKLGTMVFANCTGLRTAEMRQCGCLILPQGTFKGCAGLTAVRLPGNLTRVDWDGFAGCTALKQVYFEGTAEQWERLDGTRGNEALAMAAVSFIPPPVTGEWADGHQWAYDRQSGCLSVPGLTGGGRVYAAFYADDGRMLSVEALTGAADRALIPAAAGYAKLFWQDAFDGTPVYAPCRIGLPIQ